MTGNVVPFRETEESRFRREVAQSWDAVWVVARWWHRHGYEVSIPAPSMRPAVDARDGFGDIFDLRVSKRGALTWQSLEVKWRRTLQFTCAEDFEFQDGLFIDRCGKPPRGIAGYISVNGPMTHMSVVKGSSRPFWFSQTTYDATKGYELTVDVCPLQHVQFRSLT